MNTKIGLIAIYSIIALLLLFCVGTPPSPGDRAIYENIRFGILILFFGFSMATAVYKRKM